MYHIQYSLRKDCWDEVIIDADVSTLHAAVVIAAKALHTVLGTDDITLLDVGCFSYAIWFQGECVGFLAITEAEIYISQQRISPWKSQLACYF